MPDGRYWVVFSGATVEFSVSLTEQQRIEYKNKIRLHSYGNFFDIVIKILALFWWVYLPILIFFFYRKSRSRTPY